MGEGRAWLAEDGHEVGEPEKKRDEVVVWWSVVGGSWGSLGVAGGGERMDRVDDTTASRRACRANGMRVNDRSVIEVLRY